MCPFLLLRVNHCHYHVKEGNMRGELKVKEHTNCRNPSFPRNNKQQQQPGQTPVIECHWCIGVCLTPWFISPLDTEGIWKEMLMTPSRS